MKILHKTGLTFSIIILVTLLTSVFIYRYTDVVKNMRLDLTDQVIPVEAVMNNLNTELQTSLATLRGYLLLGGQAAERKYFLAKRARAWRIIERSLLLLDDIEQDATLTPRLRELESQLQQFKEIQQRIEDFAWTENNVPSGAMFNNDLVPAAENAVAILSRFIEQTGSAQNRQGQSIPAQVVPMLADTRYLISAMLFQTSKYLTDANPALRQQIATTKRSLGRTIMNIEEVTAFSSQPEWQQLAEMHDEISQYIELIVAKRAEVNWNQAQFLLSHRALPLANDIFENIDEIEAYVDTLEKQAIDNIVTAEQQIKAIILTAAITTFVVAVIAAFWLARYLTRGITLVKLFAARVAEGDLTQDALEVRGADELSDMSRAMNQISGYLQSILNQARSLSKGELGNTIEVRSDKDQLSVSLNEMLQSFKQIESQAQQVAQHNYDIDFRVRSDKDSLAMALRDMLNSLRRSEEQNKEQAWVMNGLNELNAIIRGEERIDNLCDRVVMFITEYCHAVAGGIFITQQKQLKLQASYGFNKRKQNETIFTIGEGLLGQAALEKQPLIFEPVPETYMEIESGLGKAAPNLVYEVPLLFKGEVKGMLELAFNVRLSKAIQEFLKLASEIVGISLSTLQNRDKVNRLLEETQQQSKVLQQQTKELEASRADLERQQEQLEKSNADLELKTAELEQNKEELEQRNIKLNDMRNALEQKAKDLNQASKYKSEFLANMSHELRTPLNSLLLLAKSLADNGQGHLDDEEQESARIVYESGNELLNLINEILDLSKIEAGKLQVDISEFSTSVICDDMKQMFKHTAENKNIELRMINNCPETVLNSDKKRFEQILKNLLSNAIKFTDEGSVSLVISPYQKQGDASEYICFSVEDTGIGISKEQQALIFEAFQQADGSTSRKYGGTGLGLTISRELSSLLGAQIAVTSEPGKGSVFKTIMPVNHTSSRQHTDQPESILSGHQEPNVAEVEQDAVNSNEKESSINGPSDKTTILPAASADKHQQESSNETAKEHPRSQEQVVQSGKNILIIEDNANLAKSMGQMVQKQGFNPLYAETASEGFQMAIRYRPVGILLDIGLPDNDDLSLLNRFKCHPELRHVPVHIITGMNIDLTDATSLGAIGILQKPLSGDDIDKLLGHVRHSGQRHTEHVLLIADKQEREEIDKIIKEYGAETEQCASCKSALKVLENYQPGLIYIGNGTKDEKNTFALFEEVSKWERVPKIIMANVPDDHVLRSRLERFAGHFTVSDHYQKEDVALQTSLFLHKLDADLPEEQREWFAKFRLKKSSLDGKRILIVDDDMRNTFALAKLLTNEGMDVTKAGDGQAAIDLMQDNHYDLILMDIMMPVMDGYEAIRQIRKQDEWQDLPIVALTAKSMAGEREKCIDLGANDFVSKPVDLKRLLAVIHVWIGEVAG